MRSTTTPLAQAGAVNGIRTTPEPLAAREMTEELKRLLACIGRLDADRRKLVLLAYYNGLSREQLAKQFGKPVNSIKTWLRRSLIEIRACLGA